MNNTPSSPTIKMISRKQIPTTSIGPRSKKLMIRGLVEASSRGEAAVAVNNAFLFFIPRLLTN